MGKIYDAIDDRLARFLLDQPVFFVGTAPLDADGHVNVSPKGMSGTFAVLGERRAAYLDYSGSGVETISHLRENGRIVLMFCAFDGPPKIVRLHGRGRTVLASDPEFTELRPYFPKERTAGQRSIIVVDVERISDSCGFAVPLMELQGDRDLLDRLQERNGGGVPSPTSIDGLPTVAATD
ncbi:pyridoxamine 5'-phosphate oxidase family protein [Nocardiopsis sp. LOL_012]|uniref:pyridoxamine 5'-phosphate oxidase family protein n=1 Tax=Nocardiopsis sp. LOL_012 TaxID=3345409 RepID=UPI003A8B36BA